MSTCSVLMYRKCTGRACIDDALLQMVPVYHCLYEGVLILLCVADRQLEAASILDFMTFNYVCGLKTLILCGSYPSAASTHRGQVVFGGYGGDETSSYLVHV